MKRLSWTCRRRTKPCRPLPGTCSIRRTSAPPSRGSSVRYAEQNGIPAAYTSVRIYTVHVCMQQQNMWVSSDVATNAYVQGHIYIHRVPVIWGLSVLLSPVVRRCLMPTVLWGWSSAEARHCMRHCWRRHTRVANTSWGTRGKVGALWTVYWVIRTCMYSLYVYTHTCTHILCIRTYVRMYTEPWMYVVHMASITPSCSPRTNRWICFRGAQEEQSNLSGEGPPGTCDPQPVPYVTCCTTLCVGCACRWTSCVCTFLTVQILMLERSKAEAESHLQHESQSLEHNNQTIQVSNTLLHVSGVRTYMCMYAHMYTNCTLLM